jgi:protein SCO1
MAVQQLTLKVRQMTRTQKTLVTISWSLLVLLMVTVVAAWRWKPPEELPAYYDAPAFSLIDQNERTITDQDLHGQVWVAAFIFTRCAGPCPMMTEKMALLQEKVPDSNVRLVSFSLDPDYDTPAVLREYGEAFGADQRRWHFLTGDRPQILKVAADMRITAMVGYESEEDIIHADYFILIDPEGRIRGYYRGTEDEELARLAADAAILARTGRLPPPSTVAEAGR